MTERLPDSRLDIHYDPEERDIEKYYDERYAELTKALYEILKKEGFTDTEIDTFFDERIEKELHAGLHHFEPRGDS